MSHDAAHVSLTAVDRALAGQHTSFAPRSNGVCIADSQISAIPAVSLRRNACDALPQSVRGEVCLRMSECWPAVCRSRAGVLSGATEHIRVSALAFICLPKLLRQAWRVRISSLLGAVTAGGAGDCCGSTVDNSRLACRS
jgi:hypothetical protein|eukprot:SAG25_NODE_1086_length_4076_cov_1.856676_2_plen_140_part_00